jgi:hypothetical protein
MGFSIGKFIGAVAPFVGGVLAGPAGAILGAGISAGLAPDPAPVPARAVTPQRQPQLPFIASTQISPTPFRAAGFGVTRRRVGTLAGAVGGLLAGPAVELFGGMFGGQETVGDILAQARQTFGRGVTRNKIIAAAKACGIDQAAATFGISVTQVCKVIVAGGSRRRRGISAADIRRTRRTLRTVKNIRADLKSIRL